MANMLKTVQQAASMRKQVKRMQKEMARKVVSVTSNNGRVTVEACGDMSIRSITLQPGTTEEYSQERLEKLLTLTVNSALNAAKKTAGGDMTKMAGGLEGLQGLLGAAK